MNRACAIILLHNNPSGEVIPSKADIQITKQLVKVGKLMGVDVLDHIVFTSRRLFYSLSDKGKI